MKFNKTGAEKTTITREVNYLTEKTCNIYKAVSILANRSKQINEKMKEELLTKLEEFALDQEQLDEIFENQEQIAVSKFYESLPKPWAIAMKELLNDEIYMRNVYTDEDIDISILTGGKISINDISNIHTENISNELGQNRKSVITILAKNKFVYLCNHEGIDTSQPVLLEDDNGFLDVKKMEVRDLKAGMHVLLRTEGGSTLLVEFANQILGENKENYRNLQQGWKSILKEGYIEKGMNKLKEVLNDNGANDLNISNAYIKRWINDDLRSIGPKEKNKKFLEAVLTIKNYQDKVVHKTFMV